MKWIFPNAAPPPLPSAGLPAGLPGFVEKLLARRAFTSAEELDTFLFPKLQGLRDPFLLPNLERAASRIHEAIDRQEKIVLYGDYDVDGVTSLALLTHLLRAYGVDPHPFLPHRMDEGYGISHEGLERCLDELHPDLLIAVDCGTSSLEEIRWLRQEGIDVIVIDHHQLCSAGPPPDCLLVNPQLGSEFHHFCSAGLAFKMAHGLLKQRPLAHFDLKDHLDLAALGTVADLVPLEHENRLLVRKGLERLQQTRSPGIRALMEVSGLQGPIKALDISFKLGPRLNASGRLDTAKLSLDLLLEEAPAKAKQIAEALDRQNRERQRVEERIREEALAQLNGFDPEQEAAIVLGSRGWHPGVIGIVASRLMRLHHRPTIVVAFDEEGIGKGSGRSIEGLSLVEALDACRPHLLKGGGHAMAAGLSVEETKFPAFRAALCQHMQETATAEILESKLEIDGVVQLRELSLAGLDAYELMEPFGKENAEPLLAARGVTFDREPRVLSEKHLKLDLRQNGVVQSAIWFHAPLEALPRPPWDVAFTLSRNSFRGRESLQLVVRHLRSAQ
ncbi:MAG: single-stranded-DNA-specific exonuclease RecJ [Verrucomicrobiota bacterium]